MTLLSVGCIQWGHRFWIREKESTGKGLVQSISWHAELKYVLFCFVLVRCPWKVIYFEFEKIVTYVPVLWGIWIIGWVFALLLWWFNELLVSVSGCGIGAIYSGSPKFVFSQDLQWRSVLNELCFALKNNNIFKISSPQLSQFKEIQCCYHRFIMR